MVNHNISQQTARQEKPVGSSRQRLKNHAVKTLCPVHVVTFTLISILATDYIQKRTGKALLFSFEYNLSPNLISK